MAGLLYFNELHNNTVAESHYVMLAESCYVCYIMSLVCEITLTGLCFCSGITLLYVIKINLREEHYVTQLELHCYINRTT